MATKLVLFKTIPRKLQRWLPATCRGEYHLVDYEGCYATGYGSHSCRRDFSHHCRAEAVKAKGWRVVKVDLKRTETQAVHDRSLYLKLKKQYEPEGTDVIIDKLRETVNGD